MRIAVVNQKGGVGKTTAVLGLASAAGPGQGIEGGRTLVVDLDPQSNATTSLLGTPLDDDAVTILDVLEDGRQGAAGAPGVIMGTSYRDVDLIPADGHLARWEKASGPGVEQRLRKVLDCDLIAGYELILFDCPPSLGNLSTGALVAADYALIVTEPAVNGVRGVDKVLDTIDAVIEFYNPALSVAGVLVNRVPPRSNEAAHRISELEAALPGLVRKPFIPARVAVSEAQGRHRPVHGFVEDVAEYFTTHLQILQEVDRAQA